MVATRSEFCQQIAGLELTQLKLATALLWYYQYTNTHGDRSASELADDLRDEGFARPNATRLRDQLARSRDTVGGNRRKTFKISTPRMQALTEEYAQYVGRRRVAVDDHVLDSGWFPDRRRYMKEFVKQINGSYQHEYFDSCAVMCRRLMETLIIETYVHKNREAEVRQNGQYLGLEELIGRVCADFNRGLSRNSPRSMNIIKEMGDRSAHHRTYIASKRDIDDNRQMFRTVIEELLHLSGLKVD